MTRRWLHILLVGVLAYNALLGGFRDGVSICLGGGHEHHVEELASECELACAHDQNWPAPADHDDHQTGCTCTDVEFSAVELLSTVRHEWDVPPALLPPVALLSEMVRCDVSVLQRGPTRFRSGDPGVRHRLDAVGSVRLTL